MSKRQTEAGTNVLPSDGAQPLANARLIVALDALLREGSVSRAAASLNIQVSAMSRLLGELRRYYSDEILVRATGGMRPTPFAESIRNRIRAVSEQLQDALTLHQDQIANGTPSEGETWEASTGWPAPPLAARVQDPLFASPTPAQSMMHLSRIGDNDDPSRRLAKYIGLIGPGAGRSRPLALSEAQDALAIILRGEADPVQIGALLIAMEYRGATVFELAGFAKAIRQESGLVGQVKDRPDLDWPAYVSPRWREAPWFIHAARLVASAGFKVLLHGSFGRGQGSGKFEQAARDAGMPIATSAVHARDLLRDGSLVYLPLGAVAPAVQSLMALHPTFEMRTPINACVNMINPLGARAMVVGAASHGRRALFRELAHHLDTPQILVVGGTRDIAQVRPEKTSYLFRRTNGYDQDILVGRKDLCGPQPRGLLTQREYWNGIWSGAARDEHAEEIIIHTTAAALLAIAEEKNALFEDMLQLSRKLWKQRR